MKNLIIGILILVAGLVVGRYFIQDYYSSKLPGHWGGKFQIDSLDDNRWTAQNIELILNDDKTAHYEINWAAQGQNFQFTTYGLSVNKASRKMRKYCDGRFYYEWPLIHIELSPYKMPSNLKEAYPPFIVDGAEIDRQSGKPVIKLSAKVSFEDGKIILQGAGENSVQLSKDGNAYNSFAIQEDEEKQDEGLGAPLRRRRVVQGDESYAKI